MGFASVGAAEQSLVGQISPPPALSVQYVIDCTSAKCASGWTNDGVGFLSDLGKAPGKDTYAHPYTCNADKTCTKFSGCSAEGYGLGSRIAARSEVGGWPTKSWQQLLGGSDCDRFQAYGIAVCLWAESEDFHQYKSGVFKTCGCGGPTIWQTNNHCVLITGWGRQDGEDYWLVKNSWDTGWGMDGYMLLQRGTNCACVNSFAGQFMGIRGSAAVRSRREPGTTFAAATSRPDAHWTRRDRCRP